MAATPQGFTAVMAQRRSDPRALDFFPTPPWATRALVHDVGIFEGQSTRPHIWEPAAGAGHMAKVLDEHARGGRVFGSDVHDYGAGYAVGSFVGAGPDVIRNDYNFDWIITNPPFNLALEFAERGLREAKRGVALLVRSVWSEGGERYNRLFNQTPPAIIAQFSERVPMVAGRWDPKATTATSYAWFVWLVKDKPGHRTEFHWIPPGARARHTRPDDIAHFAGAAA